KIQNINSELAEINKVYEEAKNLNENEEGTLKGQLTQELKEIADAMMMYRQCYEGVVAAVFDFTNASKKAEEALNISTTIATLQSQVNDANNYVNECQAKVDALTNEITNNSTNKEKQKADLEVAKINAKASLEQAQKELEQLLADVSGELNLDNQNDLISRQRDKVAKKREEVEKLREKSIGSTITAPVAGIVTSVNVTAGEKTDASRELAIMQPEGKGYSMSFSVTTEQAKKVKVGEIAEIQNSWFYSDIEATLTGIRPDPENANEKKLLVFDVKGDVQAGQSVSLSIGQRSAEYDLLVPNSAVREDNQGKFILIVESKNSPLGNRYMAKRVDVQVLGADDLKTAISAPLFGYEYVITTATQPVEAGKQVRLAETN
ncbi:MAG: HlyD family efflux transporter periplasmic adaptor subunit, partial [Lachnospiraceae bacterium]|nr:HlyD family efflux transporter periplasmic adaptor subunit [Lachnospiraceae bacterium]